MLLYESVLIVRFSRSNNFWLEQDDAKVIILLTADMISFRGIQSLKEIPKKILQKRNLNYIFGNHQEEGPDLLLTLQGRNMGVWWWYKTLGNSGTD